MWTRRWSDASAPSVWSVSRWPTSRPPGPHDTDGGGAGEHTKYAASLPPPGAYMAAVSSASVRVALVAEPAHRLGRSVGAAERDAVRTHHLRHLRVGDRHGRARGSRLSGLVRHRHRHLVHATLDAEDHRMVRTLVVLRSLGSLDPHMASLRVGRWLEGVVVVGELMGQPGALPTAGDAGGVGVRDVEELLHHHPRAGLTVLAFADLVVGIRPPAPDRRPGVEVAHLARQGEAAGPNGARPGRSGRRRSDGRTTRWNGARSLTKRTTLTAPFPSER